MIRTHLSVLLVTTLIASLTAAAEPLRSLPGVTGLYTQTIWADGSHNAFPGVARFGDHYYVTFRHAHSHQDPQGAIYVIRSRADDLKHWDKVFDLTSTEDVRDPLLLVVRDRLHVYWHHQTDYVATTADGLTWTVPQQVVSTFPELPAGSTVKFTNDRRWFFRIRPGPDGAFYSLARCGIVEKGSGKDALVLYRSSDGLSFTPMHKFGEGVAPLIREKAMGKGHEADVAFTADGTLIAAIRCTGSSPGVIATTPPPYREWTGYSTGVGSFGGPALHSTPAGVLCSARWVPDGANQSVAPACMVWTVAPDKLMNPIYVPSAGDDAYQSFAPGRTAEEQLLVYYSSHEYPPGKGYGNNPANIYLAHLFIRAAR